MGICQSTQNSSEVQLNMQVTDFLSSDFANKIRENGQEHLLQALGDLQTEEEQNDFIQQLYKIPIESLGLLFQLTEKSNTNKDISPIPDTTVLDKLKPQLKKDFYNQGLKLISEGKVAVVIMGGGQGSRLGYEHAKGMFNLQMPSKKSIFQYHCEKILKLQQTCQQQFPKAINQIKVYIMTSPINNKETIKFFEDNNYFGLYKGSVVFFTQGCLPALDKQGKVVLQSKNQVCMAPNGNGAVYEALFQHGIIQQMKQFNTEFVQIIGVDNVLAKPADPTFIGFAFKQEKPITVKSVSKTSWDEKVGVHVLEGPLKRPGVVEYMEMTEQQLKEIDPKTKQLKFNSGGIVNMILKFQFLEGLTNSQEHRMALVSKYHVAEKNLSQYDLESKSNNYVKGYKFELFFFDCYCFAQSIAVLEVKREEEFAPIKQLQGLDSAESARIQMSQLHLNWLKLNKVKFTNEQDFQTKFCEVDPLVSYDGEGLEAFFKKYTKYTKTKQTLPLFISNVQ